MFERLIIVFANEIRGKLSIGVVKFYNHGVVQAIIGISP